MYLNLALAPKRILKLLEWNEMTRSYIRISFDKHLHVNDINVSILKNELKFIIQ